jgi:hypothetical protein
MARGYWAYITPVEGGGRPGGGGPTDPDWGIDEGGHPDHGLPGGGWGGRPPHAGHLPSRPGRPVDPGFGRPGGGWGGGRPDHGLPKPPHVWPKPPGGGLPVDPGWGVGEEHPEGPVYPVGPEHPGNELPEIPGIDPPPVDPPPGTVWPPLPPEVSPPGTAKKAIVLAAIEGVGYRYVVIEIKPPHPDQGLPPGSPGQPDQGLPQPPTAQPKGLRR